jgi:hypothetical protein
MSCWPGGYIQSIETRAHPDHRAGKGIVWLRNSLDMVEGQPTTDFSRLLGMVDTANGIVPRQDPNAGWGFPNLDLQIHMHRLPQGEWLGLKWCNSMVKMGLVSQAVYCTIFTGLSVAVNRF